MLVKEYRILLPLTVEEYRIAQLYMIQVGSFFLFSFIPLLAVGVFFSFSAIVKSEYLYKIYPEFQSH